MTASPYNFSHPVADKDGQATPTFRAWITGIVKAVNSAGAVASLAAPASSQVVGAGGLQGAGTVGNGLGLSLYIAITGVASLPTTGAAQGDWAYAVDGRNPGQGVGAGTGCPVFWSNGWIAATTGAAVTA